MQFAFYKGKGTLFDRLIRWWQRGPYSHVEALLVDNGAGVFECASSLPGDGVRIASVKLVDGDWDFVDFPADTMAVRSWFEAHAGARYDWLGIFGFVLRPFGGEPKRYFCSEAIATALDIDEPFRFDPNALFDCLKERATAGRQTA
jgi:hypothetical protein